MMIRFRLAWLLPCLCLCSSVLYGETENTRDWWSFKPLVRPAVPPVTGRDAARARTPIDHFIIARQGREGLALSPEADRRTLIRRLYFDLTGLPPSPEEVVEFERDEHPDAYERLVEKLLASPRYGERWARHWLDVVHYGDTHGYDKDKLRPNAWPYRDYVIRAFNEDKPYARFVTEQLAGDVLWPDTVDGIVATGFIAAGPWDFIGHAEVPEDKIDGKVARHLDRDDMVATTMNTFCSLTVQCAQCHQHKRDPISMEEYYSLQAVFAALDRADRPFDPNPEAAKRRGVLARQDRVVRAQITELDQKIEAAKSPELRSIEKEIGELEKRVSLPQNMEGKKRSDRYGYHSQVAPRQDEEKWVQVDLGATMRLDRILLFGADEYGFADFGFPHRFRVEVADEPEFKNPRSLVNETSMDYPRPGASPVDLEGEGVKARYLRVTATKLWNRHQSGQEDSGDWIFALGELAVISEGQLAPVHEVTALDSIEAGARWGKGDLIDGIYGAYPLEALVVSEKSKTNGYHSAFAESADALKWVQIDLGQAVPVDRIELYPARPTDFKDTPGFGFPVRFKLELSDDADGSNARVVADRSDADFANPGDAMVAFECRGMSGRYVRFSAGKLNMPEGSGGYMLALGELRVFSDGKLVTNPASVVTSLDSINSGLWHERNLVDGANSRERISDSVVDGLLRLALVNSHGLREQLASLKAQRDGLERASINPVDDAKRKALAIKAESIAAELKPLEEQRSMVFAGAVYTGSGNFVGTGGNGGKPRAVSVLARGDVTKPGKEVGAGTVDFIRGVSPLFHLAPEAGEGARRAALAEWIVRKDNPLTWRTIVNRVWLYHFGRGIVDSPNDFGHMGQLPMDPELLDWLAAEFRDGNQSIKDLHRLILTSAVYRQSSGGGAAFEKLDGGNQYLWRMNRRKLEAEALRDSVLLVSGKLDPTMYGPGFQDFVIEKPEHSPHYEYAKSDPDDPKTHRRSIYRFIVRSQPQPFMDTLDCADPSLLVEKRNETLTALQALAFMNNKFVVRMAEHFAARLEAENPVRSAQIDRAYQLTLNRVPTRDESSALVAYADKYGLPSACRVIFNLSEFAFAD